MPTINIVPVNTPAGIFQSRSAFFLRELEFDPSHRTLTFRAELNGKLIKQVSFDKKKAVPFSLLFRGVSSFECVNFEDFEADHGAESKSNFDQVISLGSSSSKNLYWLWFYDDVFVIRADGYSYDGFLLEL